MTFLNKLLLKGEATLTPYQILQLEVYPLSFVRGCFSIYKHLPFTWNVRRKKIYLTNVMTLLCLLFAVPLRYSCGRCSELCSEIGSDTQENSTAYDESQRVLGMVCNTQNLSDSRVCPTTGILNNEKTLIFGKWISFFLRRGDETYSLRSLRSAIVITSF
jgi:hypothetical protein